MARLNSCVLRGFGRAFSVVVVAIKAGIGVGVHPTDFIMMTFLDFFPDCVYDARIEDCFTPERIAERAEMRAQARARPPTFTPEQVAERAARRAAYKLEHVEYARVKAALEDARLAANAAYTASPPVLTLDDVDELIEMSRDAIKADRLGVDLARERAQQEIIASARRLALGMALHSRLGENSWLSRVADAVPLLAKQIYARLNKAES